MSLTTPEKTWTHSVNNQVIFSTNALTNATLFLALKDLLKGLTGMTTKLSCNGTTVVSDGSDNLPVAGSMTLVAVGAASGMQYWVGTSTVWGVDILLAYAGTTSGFTIGFSQSKSIVAAGTAMPTAGDLKFAPTASGGCAFSGGTTTTFAGNARYHTSKSSDGANARMLTSIAAGVQSWIEIGNFTAISPNFLTTSFGVMCMNQVSSGLTASNATARARFNLNSAAPSATAYSVHGSISGQAAVTSDTGNEWQVADFVVGQTVSGNQAVVAALKDAYLCPIALVPGDFHPSAGTKTWVVVGGGTATGTGFAVIPWDGTSSFLFS